MRGPKSVDCVSGWGAIAAELKVSPKTARRWHQKRPLPITYVGGTPITSRDKLQAWVDGKDKGGAHA